MSQPPISEMLVTVLVVEDEFLIRANISAVLEDEGFEIYQAAHASEAIEFLEDRRGEIHVLFTDVNMPGDLDGIALAHHASRHWPNIAILITSAIPRHSHREFPASALFIEKPYPSAHISKLVRTLAPKAA